MKTRILSIAIAFLSVTATAQIDRPMPKSTAAPTINFGKSEEFKLKNGLTVIVVENHKLPKVSAILTIDNPPKSLGTKKGVDVILGNMLGTGTVKVSKESFNENIEQLGANVGYWNEGGTVSSLTKYFNEVFGYFADGALNPKFTQSELDAVKARQIENLKSNEKNVNVAASRMERVLTYGKNHPFAEFTTEENIKNISLADVQNYYNQYYRPNNAYLIFVGNITATDAKKLVEKYFNQWKKGNIAAANLPKVPVVHKTEIDVINMPNAVQSVVSVNYPIELSRKNPDYYAALVASNVLGGDFNSKLNMNLREKHGWTYGARGNIGESRYIGRFSTNATVRNSVTDSAVVETLKEMKSMLTEKIETKDLADIKAKFLGNFVLSLESPETVASQTLTRKTEGLAEDYYKNYLKNIEKITPEDVLRVSQKYIRPENARIVVTGKAEQIGENLKKLGYKVNFYDAYGNVIEDPATSKKQANVSVKEVVDAYIKAIGGLDKIQNISSVETNASAIMQGMPITMNISKTKDGKVKQTMEVMGQIIQKTVFDGKDGYIEAQGQKIPLLEDAKKAYEGETVFSELRFLKDSNYKVTGIEQFEGEEVYVVKNEDDTYYYSVKSGLKLGEIKTQKVMGQTQTAEIKYSDYKEENGVKFPFKQTLSTMGQNIEFTVQSVKLNQAKDSDFK